VVLTDRNDGALRAEIFKSTGASNRIEGIYTSDERLEALVCDRAEPRNRSLSKPERIRALFDTTLQKLTKRVILEKFPDISTSTIELALASLLKEGYIIKIGAGRNTAYIRNVDQTDVQTRP
jgi:Fic family protein